MGRALTRDGDFEARPGRMRPRPSPRARKYLHRVLAAAALAGGLRGTGRRRFDGSRIGRGAVIGRLLGAGRGGRRRAIVKARLVRLGGRGLAAARAHLRYIQRDGVTREGAPGALYGRDLDMVQGGDFLGRCEGDRHQFRFIVSAEDGAQYQDLKPLTRRLMAQMEADLGTALDWVAVDHLDTGHPHMHIILRGKDDKGDNLVIARDYIAHGMRERVASLVTLDLGPRTELEVRNGLRLDMTAERLTGIDRQLVRAADADHILAAAHKDPFDHALRAGRLGKLEALGLAQRLGGGRWRLAQGLEERLRRLGERGDIIRTMQRALRAQGLERSPGERVLHESAGPERPIVGRLVARGLSDELADRHYLILDGVDGRAHHVEIGRADAVGLLPEGSIVRVSATSRGAREVDRRIAGIVAEHGGLYGPDLHLRHDPSASADFLGAHVRRLEALRRAGGLAERLPDGRWRIAPDHVERAAAYEEKVAAATPVRVETLSPLPLAELGLAEGATWLDSELVSAAPEPLRDSGFGKEVRAALALRRQWLMDRGFAREGPDGPEYPLSMVAALRRRELLRVAGQMADELGIPYREAERGLRIAGRVERRVDLASGPFALVSNDREFSLVPWRDSLGRHVGRQLRIRVGAEGVSWTIGRGRQGPEIG
jgi:type IV secretory pathway VirD2 relaxase